MEVERLCPVRKDWNDDLRAKFERKENLTMNGGYMDLPRPLRRSAGVFAHGILPLQELLPQQHQEQDGGRRSARHGAVGDAQGDQQDLSHRTLPPPPLAQGKELPTEQGLILGSVGGDNVKARGGFLLKTSRKLLEKLRRPVAGKQKRKPKKKSKVLSKVKKMIEEQGGYPGAGGQRRHPLSDDRAPPAWARRRFSCTPIWNTPAPAA